MDGILKHIHSTEDIKNLNEKELKQLCRELRRFLLQKVSKTGGHLASNLGIVELTVALEYCFHLPEDKIVWDVGHQSYTHKLLTGRLDRFSTIRKEDGISGFTKPEESLHDAFIRGLRPSAAVGRTERLPQADGKRLRCLCGRTQLHFHFSGVRACEGKRFDRRKGACDCSHRGWLHDGRTRL